MGSAGRRTWLNGTFKTTAFTPSEQQLIALTPLETPNNPSYGTNGGNATSDEVFLLALGDATNTAYFSNDAERKAMATKYAIDNGVYLSGSSCTNIQCSAHWWLRSPGLSSYDAAYVHRFGSVIDYGYSVVSTDFGVRPALWVKY